MKVSDISWRMITAPRTKQTIKVCLASLKASGINEKVHVFAEPGSVLPHGNRYIIHQNKKRLGCFKNYAQALEYKDDKKYICILSDDFVFSKDLLSIILSCPSDMTGFCSLYTVENYNVFINPDEAGWHSFDRGWGEVGGNYIFKSEMVDNLIVSDIYLNHKFNYKKNEQVDALIGKYTQENKLKNYYHNPSCSEHIGSDVSTLGHSHQSRALNFEL